MGMFDYINVAAEIPLPDGYRCGEQRDSWFQTKDLECSLSAFLVDAHGKLTRVADFGGHGVWIERVEDDSLTYTGRIWMYDGIKEVWGDFKDGVLQGQIQNRWEPDHD